MPALRGRPTRHPEVVRLRVAPGEPVTGLRLALRRAVADVWGDHRVPEDEAGFTPHVSLAYSNSDGAMQPILDTATAASPAPGIATITHADLILLHRDNQQYEWTTHAEVHLREQCSVEE